MKIWLSLIILAVALIYRDSFFSPFFQDDKILLELSFAPASNFPFRPISQPLFYTVSRLLFGLNPFYFHLVLFAFFAGTVFMVFSLAKNLLQDEKKAVMASAFYTFNISHFALFYWTATSYFSIGAFFFFLTVLFYLQKKSSATAVAYLLALGSNELAHTLPLIFLIIGWFKNFWPKSLWFYLGSLPIFLAARLSLGLPTAPDYSLSPNILSSLRWYLFRAFNLPEGADRAGGLITGLFFLFIAIFVFSLRTKYWRLLTFDFLFFLLAALPFFFLPAHMSSYYLSMALFSPALVFAQIFSGKWRFFALGVYILLTILGLNFLRETHWIILKNTGPIGKF